MINIVTFGQEIHAAGLAGLPFSWSVDGLYGLENLTPEQRQAVQAVFDAHDPLAPDPEEARQASFTTDVERLTLLERLKTATASQIDNYVDNQIAANNVGQLRNECRAMFKRIIKVIALDARK